MSFVMQFSIWLLVVKISEMKLDDFYHSGFRTIVLHIYCYIHNVSVDVSLRPSSGHIE